MRTARLVLAILVGAGMVLTSVPFEAPDARATPEASDPIRSQSGGPEPRPRHPGHERGHLGCFGHCTPATTFLPMTTRFFNKGEKGYGYDLNKAKQLLKESGVATPVTLKLLVHSNDAVHQPTAVALKEMWGKLGVTIELDPPERPTQRHRANQFQVYLTSWTNDIPDPSQLAAYELGFTESQSYYSGYQSAEMNALLARGLRELGVGRRRQIYYDIQDRALRDSPLIWLYYAPYTIAISQKMKGFVQMATGPWIFKHVTVGQ